MAHNPGEAVTIRGANTMNMEIELPYFFQEKGDSGGWSFRTFKMTPRVPERFPEALIKKALGDILNITANTSRSELNKEFQSRITRVELTGFEPDPQNPATTFNTIENVEWVIKIFFDHPRNLS